MNGTTNERNDTTGRRGPLLPASLSGRRRTAVLVLALLMLLSSTAAVNLAEASTNPSIDQYVESVPSAGGDRSPQGQPHSNAGSLPPNVRERIRSQGGSDAAQLETIASSPALGAPAPTPVAAT